MRSYRIGVLGCGDYLSRNHEPLRKSTRATVVRVFDPNLSRANEWAEKLGATVASSAQALIEDPEVDLVLNLVPPWLRRPLVELTAAAGKPLMTTKPLAANLADASAIVEAVDAHNIACGVLYRRTGDAAIASLKRLFETGDVGKPVLYRQDWLHQYPRWNDWATDPDKNGGPFMDAMIHSLNAVRYWFDAPVSRAHWFGTRLTQSIRCNDTESLHLEFSNGAVAQLFISWAADLGNTSHHGSFRKHLNYWYFITDQAFHVSVGEHAGERTILAARDGMTKAICIVPDCNAVSIYDRFCAHLDSECALPSDLPSVQDAFEDLRIVKTAQTGAARNATTL